MTFSKLRVAFNNVYRSVLELPKWINASEMYTTHKIDNCQGHGQGHVQGHGWYALLIVIAGFQN